MKIKSIKYVEHSKSELEWSLENFTLDKINLLVGKNATGKSRTISLVNGLANLVSGDVKFNYTSGNYDILFEKGDDVIRYILNYEDSKITQESLDVNGKILLVRGKNGIGKIRAIQLDKDIDFQIPDDQLACVSRRDSVQHPFFENLYQWGKTTIFYPFGTVLGKDVIH